MIFLNLPTSTHSPVVGSLNLPVRFNAFLTSFSRFLRTQQTTRAPRPRLRLRIPLQALGGICKHPIHPLGNAVGFSTLPWTIRMPSSGEAEAAAYLKKGVQAYAQAGKPL
ncbi:hypothetical protein C6P46_001571 [Rhodotorula mucilaginosa]|uniref:Uncharacterized protein n=1 Tax=Rhodotorula mucilaginosa TaxID=5537 RepID=A0A9P6VV22_RHOMI|nr:hypothetical protein C6P46_001571 [Rhodotorula mucilaginosa]